MIGFWARKANLPWMRITGSALVAALLFTIIAPPIAEANIWDDRKNALEQIQQKRQKIEKPWEHLSEASAAMMVQTPAEASVQIPERFGRVADVFWAPTGSTLFVTHIQDAHGYVGAQRSLANLIGHLHRTGDDARQPVLVAVEGAWKKVDLEWLHAFPDAKIVQDFAEDLLSRSEITGEEFFAMVQGEEKIRVEGIEEETTYWKNVQLRDRVKEARDEVLGEDIFDAVAEGALSLKSLQAELNGFKLSTLPRPLLDLDAKKRKFEDGTLNAGAYLSYLKNSSPSAWDREATEVLKSFHEAVMIELDLDSAAITRERDGFIKNVQSKLDSQTLTRLAENSLKFRMGRLSPLQYYSGLIHLAGVHQISLPQITKYRDYLEKIGQINTDRMLEDLKAFELSAQKALVEGKPEAQNLVRADRWVSLQRKLWSFEMSPADWAAYQEMKKSYSWADVKKFILVKGSGGLITAEAAAAADGSAMKEWDAFVGRMNANLENVDQYYVVAHRRDEIMVQNALDLAEKNKTNRLVLVAGGFHTPGITRILREKGVSHRVVRPNLGEMQMVERDDRFLDELVRSGTLRQNSVFMSAPGAVRVSFLSQLFGRLRLAVRSESEFKNAISSYFDRFPELRDSVKDRIQISNPVVLGSETYLIGTIKGNDGPNDFAIKVVGGKAEFISALDNAGKDKIADIVVRMSRGALPDWQNVDILQGVIDGSVQPETLWSNRISRDSETGKISKFRLPRLPRLPVSRSEARTRTVQPSVDLNVAASKVISEPAAEPVAEVAPLDVKGLSSEIATVVSFNRLEPVKNAIRSAPGRFASIFSSRPMRLASAMFLAALVGVMSFSPISLPLDFGSTAETASAATGATQSVSSGSSLFSLFAIAATIAGGIAVTQRRNIGLALQGFAEAPAAVAARPYIRVPGQSDITRFIAATFQTERSAEARESFRMWQRRALLLTMALAFSAAVGLPVLGVPLALFAPVALQGVAALPLLGTLLGMAAPVAAMPIVGILTSLIVVELAFQGTGRLFGFTLSVAALSNEQLRADILSAVNSTSFEDYLSSLPEKQRAKLSGNPVQLVSMRERFEKSQADIAVKSQTENRVLLERMYHQVQSAQRSAATQDLSQKLSHAIPLLHSIPVAGHLLNPLPLFYSFFFQYFVSPFSLRYGRKSDGPKPALGYFAVISLASDFDRLDENGNLRTDARGIFSPARNAARVTNNLLWRQPVYRSIVGLWNENVFLSGTSRLFKQRMRLWVISSVGMGVLLAFLPAYLLGSSAIPFLPSHTRQGGFDLNFSIQNFASSFLLAFALNMPNYRRMYAQRGAQSASAALLGILRMQMSTTFNMWFVNIEVQMALQGAAGADTAVSLIPGVDSHVMHDSMALIEGQQGIMGLGHEAGSILENALGASIAEVALPWISREAFNDKQYEVQQRINPDMAVQQLKTGNPAAYEMLRAKYPDDRDFQKAATQLMNGMREQQRAAEAGKDRSLIERLAGWGSDGAQKAAGLGGDIFKFVFDVDEASAQGVEEDYATKFNASGANESVRFILVGNVSEADFFRTIANSPAQATLNYFLVDLNWSSAQVIAYFERLHAIYREGGDNDLFEVINIQDTDRNGDGGLSEFLKLFRTFDPDDSISNERRGTISFFVGFDRPNTQAIEGLNWDGDQVMTFFGRIHELSQMKDNSIFRLSGIRDGAEVLRLFREFDPNDQAANAKRGLLSYYFGFDRTDTAKIKEGLNMSVKDMLALFDGIETIGLDEDARGVLIGDGRTMADFVRIYNSDTPEGEQLRGTLSFFLNPDDPGTPYDPVNGTGVREGMGWTAGQLVSYLQRISEIANTPNSPVFKVIGVSAGREEFLQLFRTFDPDNARQNRQRGAISFYLGFDNPATDAVEGLGLPSTELDRLFGSILAVAGNEVARSVPFEEGKTAEQFLEVYSSDSPQGKHLRGTLSFFFGKDDPNTPFNPATGEGLEGLGWTGDQLIRYLTDIYDIANAADNPVFEVIGIAGRDAYLQLFRSYDPDDAVANRQRGIISYYLGLDNPITPYDPVTGEGREGLEFTGAQMLQFFGGVRDLARNPVVRAVLLGDGASVEEFLARYREDSDLQGIVSNLIKLDAGDLGIPEAIARYQEIYDLAGYESVRTVFAGEGASVEDFLGVYRTSDEIRGILSFFLTADDPATPFNPATGEGLEGLGYDIGEVVTFLDKLVELGDQPGNSVFEVLGIGSAEEFYQLFRTYDESDIVANRNRGVISYYLGQEGRDYTVPQLIAEYQKVVELGQYESVRRLLVGPAGQDVNVTTFYEAYNASSELQGIVSFFTGQGGDSLGLSAGQAAELFGYFYNFSQNGPLLNYLGLDQQSYLNLFRANQPGDADDIQRGVIFSITEGIRDHYEDWDNIFYRDGSLLSFENAQRYFTVLGKLGLIDDQLPGDRAEKDGFKAAVARSIAFNYEDWKMVFNKDGTVKNQAKLTDYLRASSNMKEAGQIIDYFTGTPLEIEGNVSATAIGLVGFPDDWSPFLYTEPGDPNIGKIKDPAKVKTFFTAIDNLETDLGPYLEGTDSEKDGDITAIAREVITRPEIWDEYIVTEDQISGSIDDQVRLLASLEFLRGIPLMGESFGILLDRYNDALDKASREQPNKIGQVRDIEKVRHLFTVVMPNMRAELEARREQPYVAELLSDPKVLRGFLIAVGREVAGENYVSWDEYFNRDGTVVNPGLFNELLANLTDQKVLDPLLLDAGYSSREIPGVQMAIAKDQALRDVPLSLEQLRWHYENAIAIQKDSTVRDALDKYYFVVFGEKLFVDQKMSKPGFADVIVGYATMIERLSNPLMSDPSPKPYTAAQMFNVLDTLYQIHEISKGTDFPLSNNDTQYYHLFLNGNWNGEDVTPEFAKEYQINLEMDKADRDARITKFFKDINTVTNIKLTAGNQIAGGEQEDSNGNIIVVTGQLDQWVGKNNTSRPYWMSEQDVTNLRDNINGNRQSDIGALKNVPVDNPQSWITTIMPLLSIERSDDMSKLRSNFRYELMIQAMYRSTHKDENGRPASLQKGDLSAYVNPVRNSPDPEAELLRTLQIIKYDGVIREAFKGFPELMIKEIGDLNGEPLTDGQKSTINNLLSLSDSQYIGIATRLAFLQSTGQIDKSPEAARKYIEDWVKDAAFLQAVVFEKNDGQFNLPFSTLFSAVFFLRERNERFTDAQKNLLEGRFSGLYKYDPGLGDLDEGNIVRGTRLNYLLNFGDAMDISQQDWWVERMKEIQDYGVSASLNASEIEILQADFMSKMKEIHDVYIVLVAQSLYSQNLSGPDLLKALNDQTFEIMQRLTGTHLDGQERNLILENLLRDNERRSTLEILGKSSALEGKSFVQFNFYLIVGQFLPDPATVGTQVHARIAEQLKDLTAGEIDNGKVAEILRTNGVQIEGNRLDELKKALLDPFALENYYENQKLAVTTKARTDPDKLKVELAALAAKRNGSRLSIGDMNYLLDISRESGISAEELVFRDSTIPLYSQEIYIRILEPKEELTNAQKGQLAGITGAIYAQGFRDPEDPIVVAAGLSDEFNAGIERALTLFAWQTLLQLEVQELAHKYNSRLTERELNAMAVNAIQQGLVPLPRNQIVFKESGVSIKEMQASREASIDAVESEFELRKDELIAPLERLFALSSEMGVSIEELNTGSVIPKDMIDFSSDVLLRYGITKLVVPSYPERDIVEASARRELENLFLGVKREDTPKGPMYSVDLKFMKVPIYKHGTLDQNFKMYLTANEEGIYDQITANMTAKKIQPYELALRMAEVREIQEKLAELNWENDKRSMMLPSIGSFSKLSDLEILVVLDQGKNNPIGLMEIFFPNMSGQDKMRLITKVAQARNEANRQTELGQDYAQPSAPKPLLWKLITGDITLFGNSSTAENRTLVAFGNIAFLGTALAVLYRILRLYRNGRRSLLVDWKAWNPLSWAPVRLGLLVVIPHRWPRAINLLTAGTIKSVKSFNPRRVVSSISNFRKYDPQNPHKIAPLTIGLYRLFANIMAAILGLFLISVYNPYPGAISYPAVMMLMPAFLYLQYIIPALLNTMVIAQRRGIAVFGSWILAGGGIAALFGHPQMFTGLSALILALYSNPFLGAAVSFIVIINSILLVLTSKFYADKTNQPYPVLEDTKIFQEIQREGLFDQDNNKELIGKSRIPMNLIHPEDNSKLSVAMMPALPNNDDQHLDVEILDTVRATLRGNNDRSAKYVLVLNGNNYGGAVNSGANIFGKSPDEHFKKVVRKLNAIRREFTWVDFDDLKGKLSGMRVSLTESAFDELKSEIDRLVDVEVDGRYWEGTEMDRFISVLESKLNRKFSDEESVKLFGAVHPGKERLVVFIMDGTKKPHHDMMLSEYFTWGSDGVGPESYYGVRQYRKEGIEHFVNSMAHLDNVSMETKISIAEQLLDGMFNRFWEHERPELFVDDALETLRRNGVTEAQSEAILSAVKYRRAIWQPHVFYSVHLKKKTFRDRLLFFLNPTRTLSESDYKEKLAQDEINLDYKPEMTVYGAPFLVEPLYKRGADEETGIPEVREGTIGLSDFIIPKRFNTQFFLGVMGTDENKPFIEWKDAKNLPEIKALAPNDRDEKYHSGVYNVTNITTIDVGGELTPGSWIYTSRIIDATEEKYKDKGGSPFHGYQATTGYRDPGSIWKKAGMVAHHEQLNFSLKGNPLVARHTRFFGKYSRTPAATVSLFTPRPGFPLGAYHSMELFYSGEIIDALEGQRSVSRLWVLLPSIPAIIGAYVLAVLRQRKMKPEVKFSRPLMPQPVINMANKHGGFRSNLHTLIWDKIWGGYQSEDERNSDAPADAEEKRKKILHGLYHEVMGNSAIRVFTPLIQVMKMLDEPPLRSTSGAYIVRPDGKHIIGDDRFMMITSELSRMLKWLLFDLTQAVLHLFGKGVATDAKGKFFNQMVDRGLISEMIFLFMIIQGFLYMNFMPGQIEIFLSNAAWTLTVIVLGSLAAPKFIAPFFQRIENLDPFKLRRRNVNPWIISVLSAPLAIIIYPYDFIMTLGELAVTSASYIGLVPIKLLLVFRAAYMVAMFRIFGVPTPWPANPDEVKNDPIEKYFSAGRAPITISAFIAIVALPMFFPGPLTIVLTAAFGTILGLFGVGPLNPFDRQDYKNFRDGYVNKRDAAAATAVVDKDGKTTRKGDLTMYNQKNAFRVAVFQDRWFRLSMWVPFVILGSASLVWNLIVPVLFGFQLGSFIGPSWIYASIPVLLVWLNFGNINYFLGFPFKNWDEWLAKKRIKINIAQVVYFMIGILVPLVTMYIHAPATQPVVGPTLEFLLNKPLAFASPVMTGDGQYSVMPTLLATSPKFAFMLSFIFVSISILSTLGFIFGMVSVVFRIIRWLKPSSRLARHLAALVSKEAHSDPKTGGSVRALIKHLQNGGKLEDSKVKNPHEYVTKYSQKMTTLKDVNAKGEPLTKYPNDVRVREALLLLMVAGVNVKDLNLLLALLEKYQREYQTTYVMLRKIIPDLDGEQSARVLEALQKHVDFMVPIVGRRIIDEASELMAAVRERSNIADTVTAEGGQSETGQDEAAMSLTGNLPVSPAESFEPEEPLLSEDVRTVQIVSEAIRVEEAEVAEAESEVAVAASVAQAEGKDLDIGKMPRFIIPASRGRSIKLFEKADRRLTDMLQRDISIKMRDKIEKLRTLADAKNHNFVPSSSFLKLSSDELVSRVERIAEMNRKLEEAGNTLRISINTRTISAKGLREAQAWFNEIISGADAPADEEGRDGLGGVSNKFGILPLGLPFGLPLLNIYDSIMGFFADHPVLGVALVIPALIVAIGGIVIARSRNPDIDRIAEDVRIGKYSKSKIRALAASGDKKYIEYLVPLLQSYESWARLEASRGLKSLGATKEEIIEAEIRVLKNQSGISNADVDTIVQFARVSADTGNIGAIPDLEFLLNKHQSELKKIDPDPLYSGQLHYDYMDSEQYAHVVRQLDNEYYEVVNAPNPFYNPNAVRYPITIEALSKAIDTLRAIGKAPSSAQQSSLTGDLIRSSWKAKMEELSRIPGPAAPTTQRYLDGSNRRVAGRAYETAPRHGDGAIAPDAAQIIDPNPPANDKIFSLGAGWVEQQTLRVDPPVAINGRSYRLVADGSPSMPYDTLLLPEMDVNLVLSSRETEKAQDVRDAVFDLISFHRATGIKGYINSLGIGALHRLHDHLYWGQFPMERGMEVKQLGEVSGVSVGEIANVEGLPGISTVLESSDDAALADMTFRLAGLLMESRIPYHAYFSAGRVIFIWRNPSALETWSAENQYLEGFYFSPHSYFGLLLYPKSVLRNLTVDRYRQLVREVSYTTRDANGNEIKDRVQVKNTVLAGLGVASAQRDENTDVTVVGKNALLSVVGRVGGVIEAQRAWMAGIPNAVQAGLNWARGAFTTNASVLAPVSNDPSLIDRLQDSVERIGEEARTVASENLVQRAAMTSVHRSGLLAKLLILANPSKLRHMSRDQKGGIYDQMMPDSANFIAASVSNVGLEIRSSRSRFEHLKALPLAGVLLGGLSTVAVWRTGNKITISVPDTVIDGLMASPGSLTQVAALGALTSGLDRIRSMPFDAIGLLAGIEFWHVAVAGAAAGATAVILSGALLSFNQLARAFPLLSSRFDAGSLNLFGKSTLIEPKAPNLNGFTESFVNGFTQTDPQEGTIFNITPYLISRENKVVVPEALERMVRALIDRTDQPGQRIRLVYDSDPLNLSSADSGFRDRLADKLGLGSDGRTILVDRAVTPAADIVRGLQASQVAIIRVITTPGDESNWLIAGTQGVTVLTLRNIKDIMNVGLTIEVHGADAEALKAMLGNYFDQPGFERGANGGILLRGRSAEKANFDESFKAGQVILKQA